MLPQISQGQVYFWFLFLFAIYLPNVQTKIFEKGATHEFHCNSFTEEGQSFEPELKRNDEHGVKDDTDLFDGEERQPDLLKDKERLGDWTFNTTKDDDGKVQNATYTVKNLQFKDAGIYKCNKNYLAGNVTVLGHDVTCKNQKKPFKRGLPMNSTCEVPVNGPDEVDLGWYKKDGTKLSFNKLEPQLADHHRTSQLAEIAQPEYHLQTVTCRLKGEFGFKAKVNFQCDVLLEVEFEAYIPEEEGDIKYYYRGDNVETEFRVLRNPRPEKEKIDVKANRGVLLDDVPKMDYLDDNLGIKVTLRTPKSAFEKTSELECHVMYDKKSLIDVPIRQPTSKGLLANLPLFIAVAVAAVAVLVIVIVIITYCVRRRQKASRRNKNDYQAAPQRDSSTRA